MTSNQKTLNEAVTALTAAALKSTEPTMRRAIRTASMVSALVSASLITLVWALTTPDAPLIVQIASVPAGLLVGLTVGIVAAPNRRSR